MGNDELPLIHLESSASCRLLATQTGTDFAANSSGVIVKYEGKIYLLTAWHCLSGCNGATQKPIGSFVPDRLQINFWVQRSDGNTIDYRRRSLEFDLYAKGSHVWQVHPNGPSVDLAAIPICYLVRELRQTGFEICSYEIQGKPSERHPCLQNGLDCFIVGYPEAISGPFDTPIWKRASIATEPMLDFDSLPCFLVDTIGNQGLSGSGVFSVFNDFGLIASVENGISTKSSRSSQLEGIYSGRLGTVGLESQLGRVFSRKAVEAVLQNSNNQNSSK